jgi:glycosyltransferase involved in cell wall biosynthesis
MGGDDGRCRAAADINSVISVAVCTWNRASLLRECLQTMTRLRAPAGSSWELLVVNNNSSDDTDEVIASFAGRLPITGVREAQPGLSHARNAALAHARGDYVLWTDDDVLVDAGWLLAYAGAFERWPDAAVFGGPVQPRFEGDPPPWLLATWRSIGGAFAHRDLGSSPFRLGADAADLPFGANYAVRMTEQRRFRYDPMLGRNQRSKVLLNGEETAVLKSILRSGGHGWWIPDARVEHRIPSDRQTTDYIRRYFEGHGRLGALLGAPGATKTLFGRPRWAWRQAIVEEMRFRLLHNRSAPETWVPAMVKASEAWGVIKGAP